MIDLLFRVGLSNAALAAGLCGLAFVLERRFRQPRVTHLVLLFAFLKLLSPPIVRIPLPAGQPTATVAAAPDVGPSDFALPANTELTSLAVAPSPQAPPPPWLSWDDARWALMWVWVAGAVVMLLIAGHRVWRFHRLLRRTTAPAADALQQSAQRVASAMGLRRAPAIVTTSAGLSPFVWWAGRRVAVVLPERLFDVLSPERGELLLAHEFAHIKRRDYLVRWLECSACAVFWWNPLVWWMQRKLRFHEEACCDELVIHRLSVKSHEYASTLVDALESLVCPAFRPPAIVSAINSGGVLERRIQMILSGETRSFSRSLHGLACLVALVVIPMGVVQAQDFDAVKRRLSRAVKHNEISFEQASIMMDALLEAHHHEHDHDHGHHDHDEMHEHEDHHAHHDEHEEYEDVHEERPHDELRERMEAIRDIERELRVAVERGRLSEDQAREKAEAVRQKYEAEVRELELVAHKKAISQQLEAAEEKMWAGVKAGKISEEEAKKRLAQMKKEFWGRLKERHEYHEYEAHEHEREAHEYEREAYEHEMHARQRRDRELRDRERKERERIEYEVREQEDVRRRRDMTLQRQLEEMVEAGKLSEEDAQEKLIELRKRLSSVEDNLRRQEELNLLMAERQKDAARQERFEALQDLMKQQVEAGKVPAEEAERKLMELRRKLRPQQGAQEGESERVRERREYRERAMEQEHARRAEAERRQEREVREVERRQRELREREVHEMELRRDQLMELRERARVVEEAARSAEQAKRNAEKSRAAAIRSKIDWQRIESRLEEAVKAGELNAAEAKEKLAEIKQRMQQTKPDEDDDDQEEEDEEDEEDREEEREEGESDD